MYSYMYPNIGFIVTYNSLYQRCRCLGFFCSECRLLSRAMQILAVSLSLHHFIFSSFYFIIVLGPLFVASSNLLSPLCKVFSSSNILFGVSLCERAQQPLSRLNLHFSVWRSSLNLSCFTIGFLPFLHVPRTANRPVLLNPITWIRFSLVDRYIF